MRNILVLPFILLAPLATAAQEHPMGCYVRDYSDAHLARHPEQVVDQMSILFSPSGPENGGNFTPPLVWAEVFVLLADQGHAGRDNFGGQLLSENAATFNGPLEFGVECDGGGFDVVEFDDTTITIETSGFRVSQDGCDGSQLASTLLEEGSTSTRYTLERAELSACHWK